MQQKNTPIAITAMSGIFPKALNLADFWHNLVDGVGAVSNDADKRWNIPASRVLTNEYRADKALHTNMGLVPEFTLDTAGLQLDRELLATLDPLYHLLLQTGQNLFRNPKLPNFDKHTTGLILASIALPTEKTSALAAAVLAAELEARLQLKLPGYALPQNKNEALACAVTSAPAALFATAFGLQGVNYTLDAACASSLFAVKLACDELMTGRADAMLAGGLSRPDSLYTQVGFTQLKALSKSGRCAPFDAAADGLIVGEGCGLVILKRLADAQKDGDEILAVIRGIGTSNDMEGTLLAPVSEGQLRAMYSAYELADLKPADIDVIEGHGAGTPLGDKTELESLQTLWQNEPWQPRQCALGSVKASTGHLLTAAGMAGLIKMILALRNGTIPPSLNYNTPPAYARTIMEGPFFVPAEAQIWLRRNAKTTRKAAVSAFGFGGTNAHLLLEEWDAALTRPAPVIEISAPEPVAIIGIGLYSGKNTDLTTFKANLLQQNNFITKPSVLRRQNMQNLLLGETLPGMYVDELTLGLTEFHITPNELADILPQHLLMLKTAKMALTDAGLNLRTAKPRTGALVGMDYDFGANDFCARWLAQNLDDRLLPAKLTPAQKTAFKQELADYCANPLTHNRVLGHLGGIIATRLAKEFKLGALCSTVSCGQTSGLQAVDIAMQALRNHQADSYLAGAVDLTGDARQLLLNRLCGSQYSQGMALPFDQRQDGGNPGEGAVCLVLKRLSDAKAENHRIYAVLEKNSNYFAWKPDIMPPQNLAGNIALAQIQKNINAPVELVAATVDAVSPDNDLTRFAVGAFPGPDKSVALTTTVQTTGQTGAAQGLFALANAALCLLHKVLPGLKNYTYPAVEAINASALHIPRRTLYWAHNHFDGPRTALCIAASCWDHTALYRLHELAYECYEDIPASTRAESARALALQPMGLFTVEADTPEDLLAALQELWLLAAETTDMAWLSLAWQDRRKQDYDAELGLAFMAQTRGDFDVLLPKALQSVKDDVTVFDDDLWYNPAPQWQDARTVFVFPGSGNQYIGMGRDLNLRFPDMRQKYDFANYHLKDELTPRLYMPYTTDWTEGYVKRARDKVEQELVKFIFGQAAYSVGMYKILQAFEIAHQAVAGYSLGESAAMFATGTWRDAFDMISDMEASELFKTQLFGPCLAFRQVFGVPKDYPFKWTVVWLNCSQAAAATVLADYPYTTMMIVDTPDECVVGGDLAQIREIIAKLNCHAVFLHGVATVHCKAVEPVKDTYLRLHTRETTPVPGLTYYSCGWGRAYEPTNTSVGQAILQQVLHGFDFTQLAEQMYADGYRVFIEQGPGHSLTRILSGIYGDRPHLALAAAKFDESENIALARLLGRLVSERIKVNLTPWFANIPQRDPDSYVEHAVKINVGTLGRDFPHLPPLMNTPAASVPKQPQMPATTPIAVSSPVSPPLTTPLPAPSSATDRMPVTPKVSETTMPLVGKPVESMLQSLLEHHIESNKEIAAAHEKFLDLSARITQSMAHTLTLQAQSGNVPTVLASKTAAELSFTDIIRARDARALYPRALCLEFARGLAQNVLGPEFADIDEYKVRVRLPDEPLMLADRIMEVNAVKGQLGPGSMITEHDVLPDVWYLDGGHAPVCIAVEAGQADLFLSAYMGIDKVVQGKRAYRLLDAVVEFHRELPVPGEIIAYHINIERFLKHGETYIFFFNFTGYIGEQKLITMTKGCAGFFTKDEVENSGGILASDMDAVYKNAVKRDMLRYCLTTMEHSAYDDAKLEKLRYGDAEACFGQTFAGITIPPNLQLAKGRMHLLDRILDINPTGGRWGLGSILGEADIAGNEWFLECHFVDDKVMPGTLMYECCAHTLKVFLQRMGWLTDKPEAYYGTKMGVQSKLKCRGPVTPQTKKVTYELEIKEIGLEPHPYVIADAFMYADGHQIVWFQDMPMQLCHISYADIEDFWIRNTRAAPLHAKTSNQSTPLFTRAQIEEFCTGSGAKVFGEIYAPLDNGRYLARLPQPPFLFIDRLMASEATPIVLETGHKFTSEYDIKANDWYFRADRNPYLPTVCIMEIALQPCGFSTVYMGTALLSDKGLHFRNLSGNLTMYKPIAQQDQTLVVETTLVKLVKSRDMILVGFEFALKDKADNSLVCDGQSTFGFFLKEQLASQKGFASCDIMPKMVAPATGLSFALPLGAPLLPLDTAASPFSVPAMPAKALCMLDRIDCLNLTGGSCGLGFVSGSQIVDPQGWFFEAHFLGDPVCPGSLGIEAFMQLLKAFMLERFPDSAGKVFKPGLNSQTVWDYRGQILRHNHKITVMADITNIEESLHPKVTADAVLLVDGVHIYTARNLGLELASDN